MAKHILYLCAEKSNEFQYFCQHKKSKLGVHERNPHALTYYSLRLYVWRTLGNTLGKKKQQKQKYFTPLLAILFIMTSRQPLIRQEDKKSKENLALFIIVPLVRYMECIICLHSLLHKIRLTIETGILSQLASHCKHNKLNTNRWYKGIIRAGIPANYYFIYIYYIIIVPIYFVFQITHWHNGRRQETRKIFLSLWNLIV